MASNATTTIDCSNIQENSDIQGFAIKFSCFVVQVCLAILVTWSPPEDRLQELAHLFLLQSYPVILSTFLSLGRQQLSSDDLNFTIFFTMFSPMGFYFFVSNIRDLWRNWRHIFTRPQISKLPRRVLILLMGPIFIILLGISSYPHALIDSQCNIPETYHYTKAERLAAIPGIYAPFVFVLFYVVYTIRHFKDILVEARRRANSNIWVKHRTWLRRFQFAMRYPFAWVNANWRVVTHSHPWILFFLVICGYTLWTIWLRPFIIEAGYVFSYGQFLAMFTIVQPLLQTLTFIYDRRRDIWKAFKRYPQTLQDGCLFLATGKRNPWQPDREEYIALDAPANIPFTTSPPALEKPGLYRSDSTSALVAKKHQWQLVPDDDPDAWPPVREEDIAAGTVADTTVTPSPSTVSQPGLPRSNTTSAHVATKGQWPDEDPDAWQPFRGEETLPDEPADPTITTSSPTTGNLGAARPDSRSTPVSKKDQWQQFPEEVADARPLVQMGSITLGASAHTTIISPPTAATSRSNTTSTHVATTGQRPDEDPDAWQPFRGEYAV